MDDADFDALYAATYDRLVGVVYAMCGNRSEAQDCVQDAFVQAWNHRRELTTAGNPEGWVRTVATRLAVSRWRRWRRHVAFDIDVPSAAEVGPDAVALHKALASLPPQHRRAIVLHDLVGLSVAEIASEAQVADGTVKSWLSRGRQKLAVALDDGSRP